MKTGFLILALTVGLLAGAMRGTSLAGDASEVALARIYAGDPERASVDNWDWQSRGPIETGALSDASGGAHRSDRVASGEAEFTIVEFGGARYRAGLDTGP